MAVFCTGCKTDHIDSEPNFVIRFVKAADSSAVRKGFCFDSIYGSNKKLLPVTCFDSISLPIPLAINLSEDSLIYFFRHHDRKDTIEIKYKVIVERGESQFKAAIRNFEVRKITFKRYELKSQENVEDDIKDIDVYL